MQHRKATEEIEEHAALYALGALSQYETHSFETHLLDGCRTCQTLANHFAWIARGLGYAAPEAEPGFYVRDLLEARLEREPRVRPSGQATQTVTASQADPDFREFLHFRNTSPAPRTSLLPWTAAVAFAILAALFFYAWKGSEKRAKLVVTGEREKAVAMSSDAERQRKLLESEQSTARKYEQIKAALASPGIQVLFLSPQTPDNTASIVLFLDKEKNRGLVTGQLPPAPAGRDYQLWFLTAASKISAGLLEPDATGNNFKAIDIPPVLTQITAAAITIEPRGGSEQPTSRAFVLSK